MNREEKAILDDLKNIAMYEMELEQLEERIEGGEYRITQTLSDTGMVKSSITGSKVESFALRNIEVEKKIWYLKTNIMMIYDAVHNAKLTDTERKILYHIMKGGTMAAYSRLNNIYHTHVYKIRDRGIRKVAQYLKDKTNRIKYRVIS